MSLAALPAGGTRPGDAAPRSPSCPRSRCWRSASMRATAWTTTAPILSYDEEYFQRFEPLSVGDMMKRVPGVSFQSDIGEYAEPSLRGIGSEYTQILVNGRRITGAHQRQHGHRRPHPGRARRARRDHPQPLERHRQPGRRRHAEHHPEGGRGALRRHLPARGLLQRRRDEPERVPVLRRQQRHISNGARPSTTRSASTARRRAKSSARLTARATWSRHSRRGGRGPGRAREHRHRLDRRPASAARVRAREWYAGAFYMDTDRAETEIGREFAAEDDDGEFEAEAEQANQLDDFHETQLRRRSPAMRSRFGDGHDVGDRARLRQDRIRRRRDATGWTTSTSTSTRQASRDADSLLDFLDQSDEEIISCSLPCRTTPRTCATPGFLDGREVHGRRGRPRSF